MSVLVEGAVAVGWPGVAVGQTVSLPGVERFELGLALREDSIQELVIRVVGGGQTDQHQHQQAELQVKN